jgi:bifunctional DNA-binding transcriptional regulator/antitoxin component of YhaV-PrlF toxin-antitoxin module
MQRKMPIMKMQKLHHPGSSYSIIIPKEWFVTHNIDPKKIKNLLLIANKDIRIINPAHEAQIYDEITKITHEPIMEDKKIEGKSNES